MGTSDIDLRMPYKNKSIGSRKLEGVNQFHYYLCHRLVVEWRLISMRNDEHIFIWSDGWWLENDKAWFVSSVQNILFRIDLKSQECDFEIGIPSLDSFSNRYNPLCIKVGSDIYCIPDNGKCIWVYNEENHRLAEIQINNPDMVRLAIYGFWKYENKLYTVSYGLKKIIEIDLIEMQALNYYDLNTKEIITDSLNMENEIYVLYETGKVCKFDINTKEIETYMITEEEVKVYKFCFDGEKFWMTGYRNEVYIWNKIKNTFIIINSFPKEFGVYCFEENTDGNAIRKNEYEHQVFEYVVMAGERVWFIPYKANEFLYFDTNKNGLIAFTIEEEMETRESLIENEFGEKYRLEYVKEEQFIGLYSFKNKRILEIDAKELKYRWFDFQISDRSLKKCTDVLENVFHEKIAFERSLFKRNFLLNTNSICKVISNNGTIIYNKILQ